MIHPIIIRKHSKIGCASAVLHRAPRPWCWSLGPPHVAGRWGNASDCQQEWGCIDYIIQKYTCSIREQPLKKYLLFCKPRSGEHQNGLLVMDTRLKYVRVGADPPPSITMGIQSVPKSGQVGVFFSYHFKWDWSCQVYDGKAKTFWNRSTTACHWSRPVLSS